MTLIDKCLFNLKPVKNCADTLGSNFPNAKSSACLLTLGFIECHLHHNPVASKFAPSPPSSMVSLSQRPFYRGRHQSHQERRLNRKHGHPILYVAITTFDTTTGAIALTVITITIIITVSLPYTTGSISTTSLI